MNSDAKCGASWATTPPPSCCAMLRKTSTRIPRSLDPPWLARTTPLTNAAIPKRRLVGWRDKQYSTEYDLHPALAASVQEPRVATFGKNCQRALSNRGRSADPPKKKGRRRRLTAVAMPPVRKVNKRPKTGCELIKRVGV